MGRVSPSKQNRFGKSSTPTPVAPAAPKPTRTRAQMRRSSSSAAVERATSGGGTNPTRPVQDTGGEVVSAFQAPAVISRGEVRTNANGVVQTGTNTGVKPMTLDQANALLSPGYTIQDPFSSNQLPTTGSSPYGNVGPVADGAEYGRMLEQQKPGAVRGVGPISDGEQYAKNVEAGEQLSVKPSETAEDPKNSGINWGARSAADNSDPNIARRRAFLDSEGSMQALRNTESLQGIVYAGGQHHIVNPNRGKEGENDFIALDNKDDVRGYKSGRLSADDIKNKYVTGIMETNSNSNTTQAQGGAAYNPQLVSQTTGPLADADAYGITLQQQSNNTGVSGIGPIADGDAFASNLDKIKKVRASK